MAHLTADPSVQPRWICIYPAYINSRRTQEEGRKICKTKAVDNPKVSEIKDVLTYHNFNFIVEETKQYPRDSFKDAFCKGRVRVQIKKSDGSPFNEKFATRKDLMILLGEMIPKLKGRQSKGATSSESSQASSSSSSSGGGGNKKGKKKR